MATTLSGAFTAIADAIRAKDGSSAALTPDEMVTAIENIPTGGDLSSLHYYVDQDGRAVINGSAMESYQVAYFDTTGTLKTLYSPAPLIRIENYNMYYATALQWIHFAGIVEFGSISSSYSTVLRDCAALKYFLCPKLFSRPPAKLFQSCPAIEVIDIGITDGISETLVTSGMTSLKALILRRSEEHVTPYSTYPFTQLYGSSYVDSTPFSSGNAFIYVTDELVDTYKAATNWATLAAYIKPLSELPQWILDLYDDHYDWTQEET